MDEAQIKYMADRFLASRLPKEFHPDAGISFKPTFNDHMPTPMRHEPSGTNLFDAVQATEMVRHMIEGLPIAPPSDVVETWNAAIDAALKLLNSPRDGMDDDLAVIMHYIRALKKEPKTAAILAITRLGVKGE